MADEFRYIGKYTPRVDARDIVTGKAVFLDDFEVPGMLYGKVLGSALPSANLLKVDVSKAEQLLGVRTIITAFNQSEFFASWRLGLPPHKPMLDKTVRYVGDAVALIVAETPEIADEAMDLIEVEYEPLPAIFDADLARKEGVHQVYPYYPHNEMIHVMDLEDEASRVADQEMLVTLKRGDPDKGFEESDFVVEGSEAYDKFPSPLPPEPPGVIAKWESESTVRLWATSQSPYMLRMMCLARMPNCIVEVESFNVGGSYGNKNNMQYEVMYAAAMAHEAHAPVKYCQTKNEQMLNHEMRIGTRINAKVGIKDGVVHAVRGEWLHSTGVTTDAGPIQTGVGMGEMQLALAKCPNWDFEAKLITTNRVPSGIVRGFGGQELKSALIPIVMKAARLANIDPVEFYKKNFVCAGDGYYWRDTNWWVCKDVDYRPVMQKGADAFGWSEKWKGWNVPTRVNGSKRVGVGCSVHGNADVGEDNSEAYVRINAQGFAILHCCAAESGMGQRSNMRKVVADVLNIPIEKVKLTPSNTIVNPQEFGLVGSRGTRTVLTAVHRAASDVKRQLLDQAAQIFNTDAGDLDTKDNFVFFKNDPNGRRLNWAEIIRFSTTMVGTGRYLEEFSYPNFSMVFAEVEVDTDTGKIELLHIVGCTDVGQIIDPKALEMQFHAGFGSAAIDTAVYEENVLDPTLGRLLTGNMIDYKWRPFNDFPPYTATVMESHPTSGPLRAVGFGEISGAPGPSAIMMAISNAIGKHFCEYPATPQAILKALGKA